MLANIVTDQGIDPVHRLGRSSDLAPEMMRRICASTPRLTEPFPGPLISSRTQAWPLRDVRRTHTVARPEP